MFVKFSCLALAGPFCKSMNRIDSFLIHCTFTKLALTSLPKKKKIMNPDGPLTKGGH